MITATADDEGGSRYGTVKTPRQGRRSNIGNQSSKEDHCEFHRHR